MVRVTRSLRQNCDAPACGAHMGNRKRGPHMRCELVIPTPGDVQAAVYRVWDDNGTRAAYLITYDGRTWSGRQALPARPRRAHASAVQRAKAFVRTGVLAQ